MCPLTLSSDRDKDLSIAEITNFYSLEKKGHGTICNKGKGKLCCAIWRPALSFQQMDSEIKLCSCSNNSLN